MSSEELAPKNNRCEICNMQATAGIIDEKNSIAKGQIRYTCQDHYMKLYDRIANDSKK